MKNTIWRISVASVVIIALLSYFVLFSDLGITSMLFGMPYLLWLGIILTILLVFITYLAQKNFPFKDESES